VRQLLGYLVLIALLDHFPAAIRAAARQLF
jgi:hypothetical protein